VNAAAATAVAEGTRRTAVGDIAVDGDDLSRYEREVHGVAYVVTDAEWTALLRTETSYLEREVILTRCALRFRV
jgi:hypothetical protein